MPKHVAERIYVPIDNYIYLYHVNKLIILPGYPENLTDNTSVSYSPSTSLGRSAPIYSYQGSGPRSMQIDLDVHRESVNLMNYNSKNSNLAPYLDPYEDYVDVLIKLLQAAALPNYASSQKMVDPPLVACRFGNDIFIKGVINGSVGISYEPPILKGDKFARVKIGFGINEVDAYDATMVTQIGAYRDPGDIPLDMTGDAIVYWDGKGKLNESASGALRKNITLSPR